MLLNENSEEFKRMVFAVQNRMAGGVPDSVASDAIKESYRKLCEETEAWILTTIHTISATTVRYSAVGNTDANVRRIISVKMKKVSDARNFNDIQSIPCDCYDLLQNGIVFRNHNVLTEYSGNLIEIKAAVVPTRATQYIDGKMYEDYANAIEYGAIMTLACQASRPWYSENMYGMYRNEFFVEISRILSDRSSSMKTEVKGFEG